MTFDEFEELLRHRHPAYHRIYAGYRNKKVGVKRIANMFGFEIGTASGIREGEMLDVIARVIDEGRSPSPGEMLSTITGPDDIVGAIATKTASPLKEELGKQRETDEQNVREGYDNYGSW